MAALFGWVVRIFVGFFRGSFSAVIAWIVANSSGLVKKVLVSLGIGLVTYEGFKTLADAGVAYVQQYYGAIDAVTLAYLNYCGVGDAIGIVLGGLVARASLTALGHFGKMSS